MTAFTWAQVVARRLARHGLAAPATDLAATVSAMCGAHAQVMSAAPARWLPGFTAEPGQVALPELVRRYLYAYGPATPAHFAKWLSIGQRWAQELFATAGLQQVTVDGSPAWVAAGDTAMPAGRPRGVRLLPYFDAYGIGCHPREKVFPGRAGERALNRGQAGNYAVLLVDGTVAGIWHQRRSGKRIAVTVEAFGTLRPSRLKALGEQVERLGQILEGTPTLTLGEVTVGGHA